MNLSSRLHISSLFTPVGSGPELNAGYFIFNQFTHQYPQYTAQIYHFMLSKLFVINILFTLYLECVQKHPRTSHHERLVCQASLT